MEVTIMLKKIRKFFGMILLLATLFSYVTTPVYQTYDIIEYVERN